MKKSIQNTIVFYILTFIFFGCQSSDNKDMPITKEELTEQIKSLEKQFYTDSEKGYNLVIAKQLIIQYKKYADDFTQDDMTPEYLFKAGEVSISLRNYKSAISFFERVYKHYPEYDKVVEALFLQGFVFDNYLNEKAKAKEIYEKVIKQHPNHHFVDDAKAAIKTLTMTDEELIEMLKQMEQK